MTADIDLPSLAAPDVVEALDAETIIAALKAQILALMPGLAAVLDLESEPVTKLIEVCAYRELLVRARVNDAARAVMLATATGADLDHLAALFGVARLVVTPAEPEAVPPVAAVMEADGALRARTQLALEGFSTAGPRGAYLYHALSADGDVLDASVISPAPGQVQVTVLSRTGDGTPPPALVAAVAAVLDDEDVRPLCDQVNVQGATITPYAVTASLTMDAGPDPEVARAAAEAAVRAYVTDAHRLGRAIRLSALYRALHQPGVERVDLASPAADVLCDAAHAPWCSAVTVTLEDE